MLACNVRPRSVVQVVGMNSVVCDCIAAVRRYVYVGLRSSVSPSGLGGMVYLREMCVLSSPMYLRFEVSLICQVVGLVAVVEVRM